MSISGRHWYRYKYLKSEKWSAIRARELAIQGPNCAVCGKFDIHNDIHHIWYQDGDGGSRQYAVLCRKCHDGIHSILPKIKSGGDRYKYEATEAFRKACKKLRRNARKANKPNPQPIRLKTDKSCNACGVVSEHLLEFRPAFKSDQSVKICQECNSIVMQCANWSSFTDHRSFWKSWKMFTSILRTGYPKPLIAFAVRAWIDFINSQPSDIDCKISVC